MANKNQVILGIILFFFAVWYTIGLFDVLGLISLGETPISLSWLLYLFTILLVVLLVRYYSVNKEAFLLPLTLVLFDTVIFTLANVYDWYSLSPLINRAEHFIGTLLVIFIIDIVFFHRPDFIALPKRYQIATIVGIALAAVTINELVELGLDFFANSQTIGPGLWDTNLDLLMNSLAIVLYIFVRFGRRGTVKNSQG